MTEKTNTVVLVPGNLSDHAIGRIESGFECIRIAKADPAIVTADMAARVQAVASMTVINSAFMDALPNLEIIANFGVGYDDIDAKYAASRGIVVTNTPDVLSEEVADTALGLLINTVRELPKAETYLRAGKWAQQGPYPLTGASLRGRSAGIFGMGRIGLAIAKRLEAFGIAVSYHNRSRRDDIANDYYPTLAGLAEAVDILISVAPGGLATKNAVDAEVLKALGPNGIFINIGRGSCVDEPALVRALGDGTILAAGLDVFANEPNVPDELLKLPNACLLPHVGSASQHTRKAMADLQVDNIVSWFSEGKALTPVAETVAIAARGRKG